MSRCIDETGNVYGRLTVLYRDFDMEYAKGRGTYWRCRCECGREVSVIANSLRTGNTKSCGCIWRENASERTSKNLVGQIFGDLQVIRRAGSTKQNKALWLCKCACGNNTITATGQLTSGMTASCGCRAGRPGGFLDLTGKVFGRLTVIEWSHSENQMNYWTCKCECGKTVCISGKSMSSGGIKSCGCLTLDRIHEVNSTHGMSGTRMYSLWLQLRQRCNNADADNNEDYYFAGISYCSDWDNFAVFNKWALENGYRDDLSIDRINPFRDYGPDNCRWIPPEEQAANTSKTYFKLLRETLFGLPSGDVAGPSVLNFIGTYYHKDTWRSVFRAVDYDLLSEDGAEQLRNFLNEYCTALYYIYVVQYCDLVNDGAAEVRAVALDYLNEHQQFFDRYGWPLPEVKTDEFRSYVSSTIKE